MAEMVRTLSCMIVVAVVVTATSERPARATPETEARALNAQGRKLLDEGDFVGALDLFRAAYARYPSVKLQLNIGTALHKIGRYAEAADAYERYLNDTGADQKHKAEVLKILDELRRHFGSLHVEVNEPGARVVIDGKPLGGSPQSVTIRVDEGTHSVVAEKEGYPVAAATVPIKAGEERTVELRLTSPTTPEPKVASTEPAPKEDALASQPRAPEIKTEAPKPAMPPTPLAPPPPVQPTTTAATQSPSASQPTRESVAPSLAVTENTVERREHKSIVRKPWFWGIVGGLVVAGVAVGLGVGLAHPSTPSADLGHAVGN